MKETREPFVDVVCIVSFLVLTLFFFGPANLYFTNIREYSFSFLRICPYLIGLSAFLIILPAAPLIKFKMRVNRKVLTLIFAIALMFWVQGNLLVWEYGLLDGRAIDWSAHRINGFIDGSLWILVIGSCLLMTKRIQGTLRRVSIGLILLQAISTVFVVIKAPDASNERRKSSVDEQAVFNFSAKENVVILLLDGFQGDVFQEIIEEDRHYKDLFDGFTYYRNTLGGYPCTYPSVPLMMTGQYYDNSIPASLFFHEAYSSSSIPAVLKQNGYQVDLIGGRGIFADDTIASHLVGIASLVERHADMRETAFLLDVTLFRHLPHFLKEHVYNNQKWFLSNLSWRKATGAFPAGVVNDSIQLIRKMDSQATASGDTFIFKYMHLTPPHPPIMMNERMEYEEMPLTRENYKKQAKGSLELAGVFLRRLQALGIYDQSLIFIVADHGQKEGWKIFMDGVRGEGISTNIPMLDIVKSSALPLCLVKRFGARGALQVSDAPISLSDMPETILSELGLQGEMPGSSIFDITDTTVRERRFFYYKSNWGKNIHYLQPMREYLVTGLAWLDESWRPTHKIYTDEGVITAMPDVYRYGETIGFGEGGNSLAYQGEGWSFPDKGFTPTDERVASLTLPVVATRSDIELTASLAPFLVPGKLDKQTLEIAVNGEKVGEWSLNQAGFHTRTVIIPNSLLSGDALKMDFMMPDASSPFKLGMGRDERILGVGVRFIVLKELPAHS